MIINMMYLRKYIIELKPIVHLEAHLDITPVI